MGTNAIFQGLGSQILAKAEEIAIQRGRCKNAHLETHDFQSLEFHHKRATPLRGNWKTSPRVTPNILRKSL